MKRVFILGWFSYPRGNATANYVQYLAKALQEEGFCVTVMSALNPEFKLSDGDVIGGITVRNIRWESKFSYIRRLMNGRLFPFVLAGKIAELRLTSDDILIAPTSLPAISTLFRLKKKYKFKTIGYPLEWFGVEQYKTPREAKKGEVQFQLNANHDLLFPISYHIRNQFPKTPALVLPIMADVTEFPFVPKKMDVCRFILPANGMMKDALPEMLHGLALLTKEELSRLEFHFTGVTENQIKSILNGFEYEKIKNSVILHDWMKYENLISLYQNMHFLLLARDTNQMTLSNFPSKVPEVMTYGVVPVVSRVGDYTKYYLKDGVNSVVFEGCDANSCAKAIRRAMSFSEEEYIEISSKARECVERQFDYHNWTKKIKQAIESMYSENE